MQVLFYLIALLDRVSIGEVILVLSCCLEAARDAHGMLVLSGTHAGRVAHAGRTWGAGHSGTRAAHETHEVTHAGMSP